ncbi:unnamed protein product, partial [Protopolystoma xenopodis]
MSLLSDGLRDWLCLADQRLRSCCLPHQQASYNQLMPFPAGVNTDISLPTSYQANENAFLHSEHIIPYISQGKQQMASGEMGSPDTNCLHTFPNKSDPLQFTTHAGNGTLDGLHYQLSPKSETVIASLFADQRTMLARA